jgi:hypothetical protein
MINGALLLLLFLAAAGRSSGTFTTSGFLSRDRPFARATAPPNGKALITGSGFPFRAKLYRPAEQRSHNGRTMMVRQPEQEAPNW